MQSVIVNLPGGPEVLELTETAMPTPGSGEALIKVAYAALNPLDNHARADRIKWNHPGYPFTPGFEFCGLVDAVGEGVDASLIGQRVAMNGQWGGNAEFAAVDATSLVSVPPDFDIAWFSKFALAGFQNSLNYSWSFVLNSPRSRIPKGYCCRLPAGLLAG